MRMLDYELVITERSVNLAKELNYYTWVDKKGQLVIDDFNHIIDPTGYAFDYYTIKGNRKKTKSTSPKASQF